MRQSNNVQPKHYPKIIKKGKATDNDSNAAAKPLKLKKKYRLIKIRKFLPPLLKKQHQANIVQLPELLRPSFDTIPDHLKRYPWWAVWKGVPRKNGGVDKPPTNPKTGRYALPNDTHTFSTFAEAKEVYEAGGYDPESRVKRTLFAVHPQIP